MNRKQRRTEKYQTKSKHAGGRQPKKKQLTNWGKHVSRIQREIQEMYLNSEYYQIIHNRNGG